MTSSPAGLYTPQKLLRDLKSKSESYWIKRGEERALILFHRMAKRVPAYKDFLKKNNINPKNIVSIVDFKKLPTVDKDNYLRKYPLEQLCWDGELKGKRWVFSTTSGSTGEPFYFPRQSEQDWQYALTAELYLRNNFQIQDKSTLYINCFAMGAWIGGVFTYEAIKLLAERGDYALSVISPGIFKKEIINAVKNLGQRFDQIIIGGYPPLIKDTIDDGIKAGLDWKKYQLGFIFSAESFTEKFRDSIIEKTGLKNAYIYTLNHYGTVDLGTMAHETPFSIFIRRLSEENIKIKSVLFPEIHKQPTVAQYHPEHFFFEEKNNTLLCSAFSGIPLVRYDLKDYGGILSYDKTNEALFRLGIKVEKEEKKRGITDLIWHLPLVYVYERLDFTVKLYGANIYPDTVRRAIQGDIFGNSLTGKFTMASKFNSKQDQYLEVNIELKSQVNETKKLKDALQKEIVTYLLHENSEYKSNYKEAQKQQLPKIVLWRYEDPTHFSPGGKQKWVKK